MSRLRKIVENNFSDNIDLVNFLIKKRMRYELFHPLRRDTVSGISTVHCTKFMCPPLLIASRRNRSIGDVSVYFRSFDEKLKYHPSQNMALFTFRHSFINPEIQKWDSNEFSTNDSEEIVKLIEEVYK